MKHALSAILLALAVLCGCSRGGPATPQREPGWSTYANDKYGYEIQYPAGYDGTMWRQIISSSRFAERRAVGRCERRATQVRAQRAPHTARTHPGFLPGALVEL